MVVQSQPGQIIPMQDPIKKKGSRCSPSVQAPVPEKNKNRSHGQGLKSPVLETQRQESGKFEASVGYIVRRLKGGKEKKKKKDQKSRPLLPGSGDMYKYSGWEGMGNSGPILPLAGGPGSEPALWGHGVWKVEGWGDLENQSLRTQRCRWESLQGGGMVVCVLPGSAGTLGTRGLFALRVCGPIINRLPVLRRGSPETQAPWLWAGPRSPGLPASRPPGLQSWPLPPAGGSIGRPPISGGGRGCSSMF
jgi:hypothetical protein